MGLSKEFFYCRTNEPTVTTEEDQRDQSEGSSASMATCCVSCCRDATYIPVQMSAQVFFRKRRSCNDASFLLNGLRCIHGWLFIVQGLKPSIRTVGTVVSGD